MVPAGRLGKTDKRRRLLRQRRNERAAPQRRPDERLLINVKGCQGRGWVPGRSESGPYVEAGPGGARRFVFRLRPA